MASTEDINATGRTALVIGSGPAGFTTTAFLLRNGWRVTMLDFGNWLEHGDASTPPATLTNNNREKLVNIDEFNWKYRRGTSESLTPSRMRGEYFFAFTDEYLIGKTINASANTSLAYGGLSNVWGGNVLPPDADDIQDWPVGIGDLSPYYEPVTDLMPVSGDSRDALGARFNFPCGRQPRFPIGPQAMDMLSDLENHRESLQSNGIYFGRAKLAIDPDIEIGPDGYPFGPIFNTGLNMSRLRQYPGFNYIKGVFVQRVSETAPGNVSVSGFNVSDGSPCRFSATKVFVACGVLGTSQLLARSFGLDNVPLRVKTNQNAFFPFIRFQRTRGVSRDASNSISQLFIDVKNEVTRDRFVHVEVHQTGEYVLTPLRSVFRGLTPIAIAAGRPLLERLTVMQAFLHSDFSDTLEVRFREADDWRAHVQGNESPVAREAYRDLLKFLGRHWKSLRGRPMKRILMVDPPGGSNHLGGAFPMRARPGGELDSDPIGRPLGCRDIHVTDSTVLPSLPATTLTFTIMANAARIADQVSKGAGAT